MVVLLFAQATYVQISTTLNRPEILTSFLFVMTDLFSRRSDVMASGHNGRKYPKGNHLAAPERHSQTF
jgi:hypothetical protein